MKPTPTPDVIERIAKIIDKSAWQAIEDGRDALPHSLWGIRRDGARHTAAEVIASLSVPAAAVVGEPVGYVNADYKKELDCYDTAVLHPNDRSTKHFPMIPVYAATSDMEAARIGDEVLSWMVKYDLLDAGNEYRAEDVVAVLNDLAPYAAPSAPDGWQPIDSAPRDGTRFLASVLNDVAVLHWHGGQKKGCWHDENSAFGYGENLPTHWRPLPAPPALGGKP